MDEETISWVRRTNFSHTVCHRIDASTIASVPFTVLPSRISFPDVKSRPEVASKTGPTAVQIQKNLTANRQRAVSPQPAVKLSNAFKEARLNQRRSSTPDPCRKDPDKGISNKLFNKDSRETKTSRLKSRESKSSRNVTPLKQFTSMKFQDTKRSQKGSSWTKYFDYSGGGRVTSVETPDEHMVDLSKLFLGLRFAHGAHSQLYHGIYMDESVAVKIIRILDDDENVDLGARLEKQFSREVTLLSCLHHQNVVKFIAACRKPPVFCIVTEYLPQGSLRTHLNKQGGKSLPLQTLISMALDIARGMEYIHSQGIIHRDMKPENILVTESFRLKVADFGIACEETYCDLLAEDPGTYRWMAPEMIRRKHYGRKVDVYGFGLILWEFVAGTIPYKDMTPVQAAFAVVNKNMRPAIPQDCPQAMKELMEQCWSLQPDKRPEFWQIVKVLEEFESSFAHDGTLNLLQNPICHDHKKGLLHWIQKLSPKHPSSPSPRH